MKKYNRTIFKGNTVNFIQELTEVHRILMEISEDLYSVLDTNSYVLKMDRSVIKKLKKHIDNYIAVVEDLITRLTGILKTENKIKNIKSNKCKILLFLVGILFLGNLVSGCVLLVDTEFSFSSAFHKSPAWLISSVTLVCLSVIFGLFLAICYNLLSCKQNKAIQAMKEYETEFISRYFTPFQNDLDSSYTEEMFSTILTNVIIKNTPRIMESLRDSQKETLNRSTAHIFSDDIINIIVEYVLSLHMTNFKVLDFLKEIRDEKVLQLNRDPAYVFNVRS